MKNAGASRKTAPRMLRFLTLFLLSGSAALATTETLSSGALARDIRLAGGNIKNIALGAAFQAAGNGRVVRMPHLMLAARREHEKLGRTWGSVTRRGRACVP